MERPVGKHLRHIREIECLSHRFLDMSSPEIELNLSLLVLLGSLRLHQDLWSHEHAFQLNPLLLFIRICDNQPAFLRG